MKGTKIFKLGKFSVRVFQESILKLDDGKIIIFDNNLNFHAEIPALEETDQILDYDMNFNLVHRHGREIGMGDNDSKCYQISAFIIEPREIKSILLKTPHFENHLNIILNNEETSIYSLIPEYLGHCKINLNIEASSTPDKLNIYSQSEVFIDRLESLILLRQLNSKEEKNALKLIIKNGKRLKTIALTSNNEIEMTQLLEVGGKNESIFDIYLNTNFFVTEEFQAKINDYKHKYLSKFYRGNY